MKATPGRKPKRKPAPERVIENREWLRDREAALGRLRLWEKCGAEVECELLQPFGSLDVFSARLSLDRRGELALIGDAGKFRMVLQEPASPAEGYFEPESELITIWFGESRLTIWPASSGAPLLPGQADAIEVQLVQ